jgi:hypothetical protein
MSDSQLQQSNLSQPLAVESFGSLLIPDLCTSTYAFLSVYREGISRSAPSDRVDALTRFTVEAITANKSTKFYEHELLSIVVRDKNTTRKEPYIFFLERNGSFQVPARAAKPDLQITTSATSTSSLTSTSSSIGTAALAFKSVGSLFKGGQQQATSVFEQVPLLHFNEDESLPPPPACASSASPPPSSLSPPSHILSKKTSQNSFLEILFLASTRAAQCSTSSLDCMAEDRILGRNMFVKEDADRAGVSGLREIGLVMGQSLPIDLSLFELGILIFLIEVTHSEAPIDQSLFKLGILIDVIHNEAPTYSLLQCQCYWFVATIRYVVFLLYGDALESKKSGQRAPSAYLPSLAGKWKNMQVPDPKDDVLRRIVVRYAERYEEEFSMV